MNGPCAVTFCLEKGTQLHHWAPYSVFGEESECWPTSYLCEEHHRYWHQQTLTTRGPSRPLYSGATSGHRGADLLFQRLSHVAPDGLTAAQLTRYNRGSSWRYTECRALLEREYLAFSIKKPRDGGRGRPFTVTYSTCPPDVEPSAWLKLSRAERRSILHGEVIQ